MGACVNLVYESRMCMRMKERVETAGAERIQRLDVLTRAGDDTGCSRQTSQGDSLANSKDIIFWKITF